jgi:hypothetical protein
VKKGDVERWGRYFEARNQGVGVEGAAKRARLSASSAYRFERGDQGSGGLEAAAVLGVSVVAGNVVGQPLSGEAQRALEDFAFFRLRFFGRRSSPWQERAAYEVLRSVESRDRDYIVMNEPPGSGKSTLFTHDIVCWLIARDRTIRVQIGSRTERQARMYVSRLKRSLERDAPLRADSESLARGISFDAVACLQDDFGAFKPEGRTDLWRAEALVVRQVDGVSLDDKEPTVSAWGQDSGFLGGRFDLVMWDDLVDRKNSKTLESKEGLREWWDAEAETRLEPGGTLILQGQRIAHDDLYRYCLDKRTLDEQRKYRHVVYRAHDEDRCTGDHETVDAWPKGCLLDPHRLPWKHLETLKHNNPRSFSIMYQQEDGDVIGGLVDAAWITGGTDAEGYPAPGCLDKERIMLDPPAHLLNGNGWSFITVDPSPTEWWGIIWWLYDPESGNRYIVDLHKRRMNPEQFLSLDLNTFDWSGLIHEMYWDSNELDIPITHVVVEVNAAQRWLLSQPHVQKWSAMTGVSFVPHTTSINKQDPKYGLESIGDLFRQGMIRIPWGDLQSRNSCQSLIDEATRYPDHDTTDLIMSTWFSKLAVENHYTPRRDGLYRLNRPTWLSSARRGIA